MEHERVESDSVMLKCKCGFTCGILRALDRHIKNATALDDGEFNKTDFEEFVKLHRKTIESFIIIWQNLSDKIDYKETPILELEADFQSEEMPLLAMVIEKRRKN